MHQTPMGLIAGRIVEAEAYLDQCDPASHAALYRHGTTSLGVEPGLVYMYRCMGIHQMFNVVAHDIGGVGAVLIRAVEPVIGVELMRQNRGQTRHSHDLSNGPGKLCQACGFDKAVHGFDLVTSTEVKILAGDPPGDLAATRRIGITRGVELPLRFVVASSPYLSSQKGILAPAK